MKIKLSIYLFSIVIFGFCSVHGQNVSLYSQFNGKYDFVFVGNTMNLGENNSTAGCSDLLLTSSSASLNLSAGQTISGVYLYWAGSGLGDFDVKLNGTSITAERTFTNISVTSGLNYFSAFANVTDLVSTTGNGTYTLSELDISETLNTIPGYCNNRTNFAGWSLVVIYNDLSLPLNQINIYDGLQSIPNTLSITLTSLNVINTAGAEIGFIAWEGDSNLAVNETLRLNGITLSNPPLNPANNAFNGTNSFTNSNNLYNMDLDVYNIQNNITVGNTSALIELTSGQDVVLMNCVVTKLNSQLPDATITIDEVEQECNSRNIVVDYTVYNVNSTDVLPGGVPIAIYANGTFIQYTETLAPIAIGGSESGQISLTIPSSVPNNFTLQFVVDDTGNGTGIVQETNENNNSDSELISLWVSPLFNPLQDLFECVDVLGNVPFDFSNYATSVLVNPTDTVQFFNSYDDALDNINPILNPTNFIVNTNTTTIFIRIDNEHCFSITSFDINLILFPDFNELDDLFTCRIDANSSFDFSSYADLANVNSTDVVTFHETVQDATNNNNPILNTTAYIPTSTPKEIFVRIDNGFCNSVTSFFLDYYELPQFNPLENLVVCNEGYTQGTFDFSNYETDVKANPDDSASFYTTLEDAQNETSEIVNISSFVATSTPTEIFVRIENENCFTTTSFLLTTENCPPIVYNYVSANNDSYNETFFIEGLRNVFLNFELLIYNRWGRLVWTGDNNVPDWDGFATKGILLNDASSPKSTFYYILYLNDENYPEPLQGYLYFTK